MESGVPMEQVLSALRESRYQQAVAAAVKILIIDLEAQQLSQLMDAMLAASVGLSDSPNTELQAYDLIIEAGTLLSDHPTYGAAAELRINSALFNKGVALAQLGRWQEAIAAYDDLVRRTGGSPVLGLRETAVRALFNKGASLSGHQRYEEAIAVYDDLVRLYADAPEPSLREAVAKALINKGIALAELDRPVEALSVLDEVVARWDNSRDPVLQVRAARALVNRAAALIKLGESAAALDTYNEVLIRFGDESQPSLREWLRVARLGKEALQQALN